MEELGMSLGGCTPTHPQSGTWSLQASSNYFSDEIRSTVLSLTYLPVHQNIMSAPSAPGLSKLPRLWEPRVRSETNTHLDGEDDSSTRQCGSQGLP